MDLRLLVMARLGYDPFSPRASRVVLSRIELSGRQLVGSVEVIDQGGMASGRRELTAQVGRCPELARALALSISLAIDPDRATQMAPAPAAPAPVATRQPPPPPPVPKPASPATPKIASAPHAYAFVNVALAASAGSLPAAAFGGAVSLGWRFGAGSFALESLAQQGLRSDLSPRGSLSGRLFWGGLSGCWARGDWSVCGLGVAGEQQLEASGVTHPISSAALFLGVGPRLAWTKRLQRNWELATSLEGLANLRRNGAELSGKEVWRAPPASVTFSLGLRASFL